MLIPTLSFCQQLHRITKLKNFEMLHSVGWKLLKCFKYICLHIQFDGVECTVAIYQSDLVVTMGTNLMKKTKKKDDKADGERWVSIVCKDLSWGGYCFVRVCKRRLYIVKFIQYKYIYMNVAGQYCLSWVVLACIFFFFSYDITENVSVYATLFLNHGYYRKCATLPYCSFTCCLLNLGGTQWLGQTLH